MRNAAVRRGKALLGCAIVVLCGWAAGFDLEILLRRGGEFFSILEQMFPPDWAFAKSVLSPLWQTVQMSVAGTAVGALGALPAAALCSSAVTAHRRLSGVGRAAVNVLRSVPVLILALAVSFLLGTGTLAGMWAIGLYSFGILTRMTWEEMDLTPPEALEVLAASGCGRVRAFCRTVLIQVLPGFQANCLYILESNIRHAAILGYVGAGGLGILLNEKIAWREYGKVGMILLLLYGVVLTVEGLGSRYRQVLLGKRTVCRPERLAVAAGVLLLVAASVSGLSGQGATAAGLNIFRGILTGLTGPDLALVADLSRDGVAYLVLETVCMAVTGTAIGAALSLPLAFLGCRRLCGVAAAGAVRLLAGAVRTIPAVIYGLLFVRVSGPGPFAGLLTFAALSVGMCTKLFINALDNLDERPGEALRSSGCGRLAVLRHGVWPMVRPQLLSGAFYRFDVNLREAAVMGLVGAGGIGAPLIFAMNNYAWSRAGAYLLGLMAAVLLADRLSSAMRRRARQG